MLVFSLFFGKLAKLPTNGLPYPVFYYCALLPWSYFATALQNATNIMVEQQRLITKIYFPRVVLPISAVLSGLVDFAARFRRADRLDGLLPNRPRTRRASAAGFFVAGCAHALGFGLWLSALNAVYRDVRYVVPFLVQFWMFASPVAYSSSLVPQRWRWIYGLNPDGRSDRGLSLGAYRPRVAPGPLIAASAAAVVLVLLSGLAYFRRMEGSDC